MPDNSRGHLVRATVSQHRKNHHHLRAATAGDERSFKNNGKIHWIWCIASAIFTVFHLAPTRSRKVLEELVGEEFAGYLNFDYFSANCSAYLKIKS